MIMRKKRIGAALRSGSSGGCRSQLELYIITYSDGLHHTSSFSAATVPWSRHGFTDLVRRCLLPRQAEHVALRPFRAYNVYWIVLQRRDGRWRSRFLQPETRGGNISSKFQEHSRPKLTYSTTQSRHLACSQVRQHITISIGCGPSSQWH